ncbi:response regulator [Pontibacter sp. E15-1]|uniref:response regulator n=1 Tax=Pontibacter sp. E15-1 TaxID=2919918 RepID=UPI001F4FA443|nr:response regulator [Pontibacter sp. E15-1]MCJ8163362.1 response regulator [Pontibacter sp. E15-1]
MKKIDIACIIDDDPIFVYGTRTIMEMAQFCESFMVFHNGKDAFENLKRIMLSGEKLPDLILLDLNMPIMDGWQFLDEFIQIPNSKPICIFIVTSSIDPVDMEKAKRYSEINNYLIKPISIEQLQAEIERTA